VEYAALNHLETLDVGAIIDCLIYSTLMNMACLLDKDYLRTLAEAFREVLLA